MHFYTSYSRRTWEFGIGIGFPVPRLKMYETEIYLCLGPYTFTLQFNVREEEV